MRGVDFAKYLSPSLSKTYVGKEMAPKPVSDEDFAKDLEEFGELYDLYEE
jgi:hypothetical protein